MAAVWLWAFVACSTPTVVRLDGDDVLLDGAKLGKYDELCAPSCYPVWEAIPENRRENVRIESAADAPWERVARLYGQVVALESHGTLRVANRDVRVPLSGVAENDGVSEALNIALHVRRQPKGIEVIAHVIPLAFDCELAYAYDEPRRRRCREYFDAGAGDAASPNLSCLRGYCADLDASAPRSGLCLATPAVARDVQERFGSRVDWHVVLEPDVSAGELTEVLSILEQADVTRPVSLNTSRWIWWGESPECTKLVVAEDLQASIEQYWNDKFSTDDVLYHWKPIPTGPLSEWEIPAGTVGDHRR